MCHTKHSRLLQHSSSKRWMENSGGAEFLWCSNDGKYMGYRGANGEYAIQSSTGIIREDVDGFIDLWNSRGASI